MSETTLVALERLRAKARKDRQGYAFPLFLFGALILVAPLLYRAAPYRDFDDPGFAPGRSGSNVLVQLFRTNAGQDPANPTLIACYWLAVLVGGFAATTWWYRRRARRVGVETDTRAFLVAAATGFAGCFVGAYAFSGLMAELYGAWFANLSILVSSALVSGLAIWWHRRTELRVVPVFVASVAGAVAFSSIAVYANRGFSALLVIAGGLLVLAWLERSALLAFVGILFTLVAVPTVAMVHTAYLWVDVNGLAGWLGWYTDDLRVFTLQQMLLPAVVLLVGGTVATLKGATR